MRKEKGGRIKIKLFLPPITRILMNLNGIGALVKGVILSCYKGICTALFVGIFSMHATMCKKRIFMLRRIIENNLSIKQLTTNESLCILTLESENND